MDATLETFQPVIEVQRFFSTKVDSKIGQLCAKLAEILVPSVRFSSRYQEPII